MTAKNVALITRCAETRSPLRRTPTGSKTPRAGQLYPLGANKKFPAKVLSGEQ